MNRSSHPQITLLAIGTRGDVQPMIVLGTGLKAAGFDVRLASHASLESLVTSSGLEFSRVDPDSRDRLRHHSESSGRDSYDGLIPFVTRIRSSTRQTMLERTKGCWEASKVADLVIASPWGIFSGIHIAEKLGIPLVRISYAPSFPTRSRPSPVLHPSVKMVGPLNLWSYRLTETVGWTLFRSHVNSVRRDVLRLPPLPRQSPLRRLDERKQAVLNVYSPAFWPPPSDWGSWIHTTGFLFSNHPANWQPSPELATFLEAGPPPVYVGFGSMPSRSPKEMSEIVMTAVDKAGQRAVLGRGWGGLDDFTDSEHIMMIDEVPHDWLFPRLSAVVHHGGLSVTGVALRAGVPMGTVPFLPDGRIIGHRVSELGLGPRPLSRRSLSPDRLANVIKTLTTDQSMKQRAEAMSERIKEEDGLGEAVRVIENVIAGVQLALP